MSTGNHKPFFELGSMIPVWYRDGFEYQQTPAGWMVRTHARLNFDDTEQLEGEFFTSRSQAYQTVTQWHPHLQDSGNNCWQLWPAYGLCSTAEVQLRRERHWSGRSRGKIIAKRHWTISHSRVLYVILHDLYPDDFPQRSHQDRLDIEKDFSIVTHGTFDTKKQALLTLNSFVDALTNE